MQKEIKLFHELSIRGIKFKNRIFVSPMCQYSAVNGLAQPWHIVHLGTRATGGAGLVMAEATAVSAEGRISPGDLGLWNETQAKHLKLVTDFIHSQKAVSAVQLAHAGRKAGTAAPWLGGKPLTEKTGAWPTVAPSAIPYGEGYQTPKEMTEEDINKVISDFEKATRLAQIAGFQVVEIHAAHGYLLHEFLSPLTNQRKDQFGGPLIHRMKFPLLVAKKVRDLWPQNLPVFVRVSATDWADGGWDLDQCMIFCKELKKIGIDLIDCSSGGLVSQQKIRLAPGYQVIFARDIKAKAGILTGAVGLITEAEQAEKILEQNEADVIFMARELLRNPYWPLQAAHKLGAKIAWPPQYERAPFV